MSISSPSKDFITIINYKIIWYTMKILMVIITIMVIIMIKISMIIIQ
jgi:hypothetical protein